MESVLAQTYENWELLLVDDGSVDESTEIARQYSEGTLSRPRWPPESRGVFVLQPGHPEHLRLLDRLIGDESRLS